MALEKMRNSVTESARGTRDFVKAMSEQRREGKALNKEKKALKKVINDHNESMLKIEVEYRKEANELDEKITRNVTEGVRKSYSREKFDADELRQQVEARADIGEEIKEKRKESSEEFKEKQSETERRALEHHLDGILLAHERGEKKRTWKQWSEEWKAARWRDMLEGRNKSMIAQLESYGLNDRSLRNVSDLTRDDLKKYAENRSKELRDNNFSFDNNWDDVKNDFLDQHKKWQSSEEDSEAFGNLMNEVKRENNNISLYDHKNGSIDTLISKNGKSLYSDIKWSDSTDMLHSGIMDKKRSKLLDANDGSKSKGGYLRLAFRALRRSIRGDRVSRQIQEDKKALQDRFGREMDAHSDESEKVMDRLGRGLDVLNKKEELNRTGNEADRKRDWQYNVEKSIRKSYQRSHVLGLKLRGTHITDSNNVNKAMMKLYYAGRIGIEKLGRMALRRWNRKLTKDIRKLNEEFESNLEKFRTNLDKELETRPHAAQFLEDNPELKKQFADLQEAPGRGPDRGRDLGMRNDFEPRRGQIELHAKKQLGNALQFGLDKDGRQAYYQQLAQGVEEVWKSDIGEGQKAWGKNQTLEGRLHTERGLGEVAFYGQREEALDRLETWLKDREKGGKSLKLDELELDGKEEIDNITGEMSKYKEKVIETDERIKDEVKETYTALQTKHGDSKYAEVMEAGLKRTEADKLRRASLPSLGRDFGGLGANEEQGDKTGTGFNPRSNTRSNRRSSSRFSLNDTLDRMFDETLNAGLSGAEQNEARETSLI